ncbi:hypothetical protein ABZP36_030225, partial [Zizania latifolia]
ASVIGAPLATATLLQPTVPAIGTTDPDFDLDIKDDVQEECSKFGAVNHIFHRLTLVPANILEQYLHFGSVAAAINAQRALHGRWFAGKMITATFM